MRTINKAVADSLAALSDLQAHCNNLVWVLQDVQQWNIKNMAAATTGCNLESMGKLAHEINLILSRAQYAIEAAMGEGT